MKKARNILRMMNVRQGEEKLVSLLMAYSFFMGGATALFYTVVASTFLTSFDRVILPQVYITGGIFIYLLGVGVTRLQKKLPFDKLAENMLSFLIVSLAAFLSIYYFTGNRWVFFALFIWNRVFVLVNGVTFWAVVARLFNLQQSKRLSSLINTGDVISSVMMYMAVPFLVKLMNTEALLLVAVLFLVVCGLLLRRIHRDFVNAVHYSGAAEQSEVKTAAAIEGVVDPVYYRNIFFLALIPVFALFYVEYIFFTESRAVFPNKELLAGFLGIFFGVSAIIELVIKTFLYNKLISKYGIKAGILILPLSLLFSFGVAVIYGLSYDTAAIFFACIALSRFFMSAVRKAVSEPAYQVLYQPIPAAFRLNIQGRIEGRAKAIGGLIAGVILYILVSVADLNVLVLSLLFLLTTIIWIVVSVFGQNSYKKMVREKVFNFPLKREKKRRDPVVSSTGEKSFETLVSQVFSADQAERIEAAMGFGPSNRYASGQYLIPLLQDKNPDVRVAAIFGAGELGRRELWPYLIEQLDFDRYASSASSALIKAGAPLLKNIEKSFLSNSDSKAHQLKLLKIVEEIGGSEGIRFLRRHLENPKRFVKDRVVTALRNLGYTANSTEQSALLTELDEHLKTFAWLLATQFDLADDYGRESQLMQNLEREKKRIILKAFTVLEVIFGSRFHVITLLTANEKDVDARDYLIEISDLLLPENIKNKILPYLDCDSLTEMRNRYSEFFPQATLPVDERLMDIVNKDYTRISRWTKAVAIKELRHFSKESVTPVLVANAVSSSKVISETAFYVLRIVNPNRFETLLRVMVQTKDVFHLKIMEPLEWLSTEEDLLICKLRRLRSTAALSGLSNSELQRILLNSKYFHAEVDEVLDLRKHTEGGDFSLVVTYGRLFFSKIGYVEAGEIRSVRSMKKDGAIMIPNVNEDSEFYLTESYLLEDLNVEIFG